MYTVYRKGQGTIGEVFIFYVIIFMNIALMLLLIAGGGVFTKEVDPAIEYELDTVRAESAVTATTNDYIYRAEQVEPGKYEYKVANELLSMYFSTPGDSVYIGEREIPKSELGSDIEYYLKYKMDKFWLDGPGITPYWFQITHDSGDQISVNTEAYEPSSSDQKISIPLALTQGEHAIAALWLGSDGWPERDSSDPSGPTVVAP